MVSQFLLSHENSHLFEMGDPVILSECILSASGSDSVESCTGEGSSEILLEESHDWTDANALLKNSPGVKNGYALLHQFINLVTVLTLL